MAAPIGEMGADVDRNHLVATSSLPSSSSSFLAPVVYRDAEQRQGGGGGEDDGLHLWVEGLEVGEEEEEQEEKERAGEDLLTALLPILDEGVDLFAATSAAAVEEMLGEEEKQGEEEPRAEEKEEG